MLAVYRTSYNRLSALARLAPCDDRLDRQRLAFLAGQASMSAEIMQTSPPRHDSASPPRLARRLHGNVRGLLQRS